ncbi:MAG: AAA family ATPase [Syntrophales bacterium]|nr:AAA family ATPase [Syntrophales bacterium]
MDRIITAMSNPAFYPHNPESVDVVQTHISFIFLAGDEVYKVKKPVDFGFLDFTTLEKRRFFCEEELRLNRRLAPSVYLDVVPVTEQGGSLSLSGAGQVVEYALRMRRLPEERMLKKLLNREDFDPSVMDVIAEKLASFHRDAATGEQVNVYGSLDTIRRNHEENFYQTEKYRDITIPSITFRFIKCYAYSFMEEKKELFEKRVRDGRIREGHGDLHLEHIIVADEEVVIFDCIEFNERFRCADVVADVAFLAMDLDYNGYPSFGDRFVKAYVNASGDGELNTLLDFYKCYYAYVRGKVVSFKLDDPHVDDREKERDLEVAQRYFDLAYTYAARMDVPVLVVMAGLMGTGKSVLAERIGKRIGAEVIRSDVLRKEMFSIPLTEHRLDPFGEGLYTEDISKRVYARALERALSTLSRGKSVIIDASYKRAEERKKVSKAAETMGVKCFVVECLCPEETVKSRLESRMRTSSDASDGRWEIFEAQKKDFEPVREFPSSLHIRVDTSQSIERCEELVLTRLKGWVEL